MNPLLQEFIRRSVKTYYRKRGNDRSGSPQPPKKLHDFQVELAHAVQDYTYLIIGVFSAAFGLEGFLIPNGFIDGGVMGISLIAKEISDFPLPILIVVFNLPFLALAFRAISTRFALKSILGIVLLAGAVHFLPIESVTDDNLLVAAFGGIFLGLGIGLAIRGGAIIDGTEVLAIYLSRKSSFTVGNIILIFNILIFLAGAYFLSVEIALYATLTYFIASKTVDFVIDGVEEFMAVTIISNHSEAIRRAIINSLGRGCTIFKGQKGFSEPGKPLKDTDIVYTVITRLEMAKLRTEIDKLDEKAFIVMTSVKDTRGGMIKKKPIKKIK